MHARRPRRRILLFGSYGHGNVGDDLLLASLARLVRRADADAEVVGLTFGGDGPATIAGVPVRSLKVRSPGRMVAALGEAIGPARALLIGPGGLISDHFPRSMGAMQALVCLARTHRVRVGMVAVGIGPLRKRLTRALATGIASLAERGSVRDGESLSQLPARLRAHFVLGSDLAWMMDCGAPSPRQGIVVSLRPWSSWPEAEVRAEAMRLVRSFLDRHPEEPVELVAMDRGRDTPVLEALARELSRAGIPSARIADLADPDLAPSWFSRRRAVVAMRFHAALLGAGAGAEVAVFAYDDKMSSLAAGLELPAWTPGGAAARLQLPDPALVARQRALATRHADVVSALVRHGS